MNFIERCQLNPPKKYTLLWYILNKMVENRDKEIRDNWQDYGDYLLKDEPIRFNNKKYEN